MSDADVAEASRSAVEERVHLVELIRGKHSAANPSSFRSRLMIGSKPVVVPGSELLKSIPPKHDLT
jgi:hypothetical protein